MKKELVVFFTFALILLGCEKQADVSVDTHGFSAPTQLTVDLNAAVEKELPLEDQPNLVDAGHHGQVPMGVFYGDAVAVGVEANE